MKRSRRRAMLRQLRLVTRLVYDPSGRHRVREQYFTANTITERPSIFNEEVAANGNSRIADTIRPDRGNAKHIHPR